MNNLTIVNFIEFLLCYYFLSVSFDYIKDIINYFIKVYKFKRNKEIVLRRFYIGDIVQLKSGSVNMTVIYVDQYTNYVKCSYFDEDNNDYVIDYHVNCLVKVN